MTLVHDQVPGRGRIDARHGLPDPHRLDRMDLQASIGPRCEHPEQAGLVHRVVGGAGEPAIRLRGSRMGLNDGLDPLDGGQQLCRHRVLPRRSRIG